MLPRNSCLYLVLVLACLQVQPFTQATAWAQFSPAQTQGLIFAPAVAYDSGDAWAYSVAVRDVNGDGKPDLLVANGVCAHISNSCVGVLLGNGDGTFRAGITYDSGGQSALSVAVGDVSGDGKPDLLVANGCVSASNCTNGSVGVLLGNGDGTFQAAVTYGSGGSRANSVAVGDVSGDGKPDLLVANQCKSSTDCTNGSVGVLLGNGDGTFQAAVTYGSGVGRPAWSVATEDVNGDSKPDLLVANRCDGSSTCAKGKVGVLLGNGDGTFQAAVTYDSGGSVANSVAVGDVSGDGKPDLLVANWCVSTSNCTNGSVGVLLGNGDGTFQAAVTFGSGGYTALSVAARDVNGDGKPDLLASNRSAEGTIDGNGTVGVLINISQPAVTLSPTNLNFGNQTVGINSAQMASMLTNTGAATLTITSIAVTGLNRGSFAESNNCPGSLAPNASCNITVTFKPTGAGSRIAAVSITDNAPGSPQQVSLSGVGVLPAVRFSPTTLTFPTQLVFTTSKAKTIKLTNTGLGILKILSKVTVTGPFTQSNNCGSTVNPGVSCTFTVTFKPITIGPLTGSLSLTDNAPLSPQAVPLKGTGTYIQLAPSTENFGTQPVGTTSLAKTITLSNKGSVAVGITSISITGLNPGDFSQTNNCGTSVAAGASCFIKVKTKPTAAGIRKAAVAVFDNGGGSPQKVSLVVTGT